jgi:hypothetical protein
MSGRSPTVCPTTPPASAPRTSITPPATLALANTRPSSRSAVIDWRSEDRPTHWTIPPSPPIHPGRAKNRTLTASGSRRFAITIV